jgi:hypothetical protein
MEAVADAAAERRMASEIYGLIIASSVLAAGDYDEDIVDVSVSVLVTLVVYWLAEAYAHVLAARHARGHLVRWPRLSRTLRAGWPLVSASFLPLVAVVGSAILGADVPTAQTVGMLCATVLLFGTGWVAAARSRMGYLQRLLSALVAAGFGVALIALKAALH